MRICSLFLIAFALAASGCIVRNDVAKGAIYTDVKGTVAVTPNPAGAKVGRSEAMSILGVIGLGDASIDAAARNGRITRISHVDYETMQVLGIYGRTVTLVHGE